MKHKATSLAVLLGAALATGPVWAQQDESSAVGILPDEKGGLAVKVDERNPFANRAEEIQLVEDSESEAARIRRKLEGLPVVGMSNGPRGIRILLGDLILQQGEEVAPVVQGQTDRLVVTSATEEEVELTWIVESGKPVEDGRRLLMRFDLSPKVQVILPGQGGVSKDDGLEMDWARLDRAIDRNPSALALGTTAQNTTAPVPISKGTAALVNQP